MRKLPGQVDYNSNFTTALGIVKNNADPAQHGRLQVYIPSIDSRFFKTEDLPWTIYISPFGGTIANFKAGREQSPIPGISSYGLWAIPKIGGQVLCGFLQGDPHVRYWMGCVYLPEFNRTLPQSIDGGLTEIDDSGVYPQSIIPHYQANLTKAGLEPGSIHYKTRGGYERSISYPSNKSSDKKTTNGYAPKSQQPEISDSQTICLTSPGRHYFVMSDVDEYCRIRLKTTEGSQIIFDDTNERIYISTAQGKNWVELDEGNGKVYIYSDSKVSVRSKNDINLYSDENINIVANKRVNIKSETRAVNIEALQDVRMLSTQADVMMTASRAIHIKTTSGPTASSVPEQSSCSTGTKGLIYSWPEKGGSAISGIYLDSSQGVDVSSLDSISLTSSNDINVKSMSSSLNLQASMNVNLSGLSINFTAPLIGLLAIDPVNGPEQVIALNNADLARTSSPGMVLTSSSIIDKMIRPDHEPWVRDEDEGICKTPRNKKYQG
jgi:hypothetical protein